MKRFGTHGMCGQALIMFVLVSAALVMVLGLAIDASGGWWKSQRQNDAIEIAKESALSRSNEIKFDATDSTRAIDEVVYSSLTENLKDIESSEVSVTSWEVPETKTGSMNRLIGVEVTVTGAYRCVFAQTFGFSSIPVKNTITFTINPYSSTEALAADANGTAAVSRSTPASRSVRKHTNDAQRRIRYLRCAERRNRKGTRGALLRPAL